MNSSRSSGKPNGGAPRGGSSTTSRKSPTKKFGKNLNKLTSQKLSAPPVPVPNSIRGTTSFSGSATSRNGLLLLSTKSKSTTVSTTSSNAAATNNTAYTPEGARAAGVLAPLGRPSTAHDKLLQSAGSRTDAIGLDGTIDKSKSTATPAWGITEKKPSSSELPQPKNYNKAPMLLQAGRPSVPINSSKEVPWSINERLINEPPSIDRRNNNNPSTTMINNMERSGDNNNRPSSSSYRGNYSGDYNNRSSGDYNNFNNRNSGDYNRGGDYRNRDSPGGDYRSGGGDYNRSSSSRFENRDYNNNNRNNGGEYHQSSSRSTSRYNTGDSYQMASSRYSESSNSREYNRNGGDTSYQSASRFGSSSRSTSSSGYNNNDSSLGGDYRSSKRHNDRDNMQQQQEQEQQHHEPPVVKDRFANFSSANVKDIAQNVEQININEVNPTKIKINTDTAGGTTQSGDNETAAHPTTADNKPTPSTPQSSGESPPANDVDQVEYMSKLAKERQEKRRLEEEERMAAQKERAAARLRELEGKRMEEKKKEQQEQSETRKELSKPSMPLELLGKSKKDTTSSTEPPSSAAEPPSSATYTAVPKPLTSSPERASPLTNVEKKKVERTLYDPERPVWGKGGSKTDKQQEVSNSNKSPVHGPSPTPVAGFSATTDNKNKKGTAPIPIQMARLSDLRSDEQVDRVEESGGGAETTVDNSQSRGGGPRLLFDPTSGGMVSASVKNSKQKRSSKDTSKTISRGSLAAIDGSDTKPVRGKQGRGNRKDDATVPPQRNKKRQPSKKRNPRTRGVLYKLDKGGNYMAADGCEPDNGYGSHQVPGGKVKNPTAYAKLMKKEEVQTTKATAQPNDTTVPTTTTTTATEGFSTATEGFSYRNDPGFIQHQFEAQQQKILEDAWASLVENKDDEGGGGEQSASLEEQVVPTAKSGDDEYAAALAISPSRIGLNFDTNNNMDSIMLPPAIAANAKPSQEVDLAQFAFETTNTTTQQPAANPFASLGTGLWGGGSSAGGATTSTSYGDLGALTGWAPTPFAADTTAETAGQSSKLGLWGSSALDDVGLGSLGGDNKSEETTNGTD